MKITIDEAQKKYFSTDWCLTVPFEEFINILTERGIEVIW